MKYLTLKEQEDAIKWMIERRIPFTMIPVFMDLFYKEKYNDKERHT